MKGYLFNVITDEELVNYLKERYKDDIIIYDYTCYKIECKKNDAPKDKFIKEIIDGYNKAVKQAFFTQLFPLKLLYILELK